jgi:hypothetical protein
MKSGEKLQITPKGVDELRGRASKLDLHSKIFLSLIEQGATTSEALMQRSKATREQVADGLRLLMSNKLVETGSASPPASPSGSGEAAPSAADSISERLRFKPGISPSQARFALSNFCLDVFGTAGQDLADVVEFCNDVSNLQMALDTIRSEIKKLHPERRPDLVAVVREINETDF